MVRTFLRDAALPCTWLLLHTPVTADQVTLAALLTGLAACLFLALPGSGCFLAAVFLLQLWYYLDHVDGQIARYRKTACLTGRFFDFLMHHMVHAAAVLGLGMAFAAAGGLDAPGVVLAVLTAFSMTLFNLLHDIKSKAFVEKLEQAGAIGLAVKSGPSPASGGDSLPPSRGIPKRLFSFLHKSCEIHVLMNALTVLAVLELFIFKGADFRFLAFVYYAPVILAITLLKYSYVIVKKKVDEEFDETFTFSPKREEKKSS